MDGEWKSDVFDKDRVDNGISAVCAALDFEGLSLFERWHVCRCVELSAFELMSKNLKELARKVSEKGAGAGMTVD